MNQTFREGFIIPLVASLLLLGGFIVYFLNSEYAKEKEAIILESRDEIFVDLFTNIRGAGPVEWTKDSLGNDVLVKFRRKNDSIISDERPILFDSLDLEFETSFLHHAEVITVDESTDSITAVFKSEGGNVPSRLKIHKNLHKRFESDGDTMLRIEVLDFASKDYGSRSFLEGKDPEVNPLDVWKRMIPQLLFSLLLFGSVAAAYYMISRNLRKEKELAQLRNDFMSNMSHELKTPVSTISVALEALSNFDAADNEQLRKEYIDISKTEVERLGLLVDKALNISLFEQGKFIYDKHILDLNIEIENVLKTLKVQLDNHSVELSYQNQGNNFNILADKTHIINVIHNLIENAIKYSQDSPEISIRLTEQPEHLELLVEDKGRGIAPAFKERIFDKFFRVPQGDRHNTKGHGLGLSYVKEVVTNHGGEIGVESTLGEGSSFIISLPKV